jgi:hypothetical protein
LHQDEGWHLHQPATRSTVVLPQGDVAEKSAIKRTRQPFVRQEGIMARRDFPLSINRRRLLATGAAAATAAISLRADRVDAALADTVQLPALTPEVPPLTVCAATARRLLEIARRNEIRREAGLPLLSTVKELRRMKEHEDGELRRIEFEQIDAQYQKEVWDAVLRPRREADGNPNWFTSYDRDHRGPRRRLAASR